jgi:hypothetical protein
MEVVPSVSVNADYELVDYGRMMLVESLNEVVRNVRLPKESKEMLNAERFQS